MNILLITGESGVGKTAIGLAVSKQLRATFLRSRDIARFLAHREGFTGAHDWIKALGLKTAAEAVHNEILAAVDNAQSDALIVIDGVYDTQLLTKIEERVGKDSMHIVEITVPKDKRLDHTDTSDPDETSAIQQEMEFLDGLKKSAGLYGVTNKAELVVENLHMDSSIEVITAFLAKHASEV
ncbi:MAG TPA: hypothetical protein VLG36_00140 [Candidatus Chromulinivoraceae bacterium]|nr:hypothetical protein [Candidatus Chromulinivoraceae bacterium]